MKKMIASMLLLLCVLSIGSTGKADPALLQDMYDNPQNYIHIGGAGTGLALYVSKSSVDVQQYAPPNYVISVTSLIYSVQFLQGQQITAANLRKPNRYRYDYASRKIYHELYDDKTNKASWEYLDPTTVPRGKYAFYNMAMAELAFYWAYNMSFYDEPVSSIAQIYIESGKGTFDAYH